MPAILTYRLIEALNKTIVEYHKKTRNETSKSKNRDNSRTMLGDKPVNGLLNDIADLCHERLEYSTSKQEECEILYEDSEYEDYRNDMEDRVSVLEGCLCRILDLLEDKKIG